MGLQTRRVWVGAADQACEGSAIESDARTRPSGSRSGKEIVSASYLAADALAQHGRASWHDCGGAAWPKQRGRFVGLELARGFSESLSKHEAEQERVFNSSSLAGALAPERPQADW